MTVGQVRVQLAPSGATILLSPTPTLKGNLAQGSMAVTDWCGFRVPQVQFWWEAIKARRLRERIDVSAISMSVQASGQFWSRVGDEALTR